MRLLLVGESILVLQGLAILLVERPDFVVCACVRPYEAVAAVQTDAPEVVVVETADVLASAPLLLGIQQTLESPPVVVIAPPEPEQFLAAVRLGARGFVGRDVTISELHRCIEVVGQGEWGIPRRRLGDLVQVYSALAARQSPLRTEFTEREQQILYLLAEGYNLEQMSQRLSYSTGTVRSTIRSLTLKLGVGNRLQAVGEAYRRGLLARHKESTSTA